MTWRVALSIPRLFGQLRAAAPRTTPPGTPADAWGTIGDAVHDPTSDHSPKNFPGWGSQIVTAGDFPNRPDLGLDAHAVLDSIRRSRDPRLKYAISNDQICSSYATSTRAAWTWGPYNPGDPNRDRHREHGHLSVVGDARADGAQPWAIGTANVEVDMTPEEHGRLVWTDAREEAFAEMNSTYNDPDGHPHTHKGVAAIKALQTGPVPQEAVNAAVAAALSDPAVTAALVKAVNDDAAARAAE